MIYNADCFDVLPTLPDNSVDAVITDPPYGTTRNKWDVAFDLSRFWSEIERVNKGVVVAFTAQPFTTTLIASNQSNFRYDLVWKKTIGSGQLNISHQPLRTHESILVFYKGTYNPQMTQGTPYTIKRKQREQAGYGEQKTHTATNSGFRHPTSVIEVSNPRIKGGHPTQKPVPLMEWLVKTYTNLGDIVLDPFMGSGTTGVAAQNLNRQFIGVEKDKIYYEQAKARMMVNV